MPEPRAKPRLSKGGWAWLILIGTPPAIIVSGVIALFVWQMTHGEVSPKWRKRIPSAAHTTNRVDGSAPVETKPR